MVDTAEPSLLAQASCTAALPQAPQAPQFPVKTHPVAVSCSRPSPLSRLTGALSQVLACLLSRDPGPPQEAGGQQAVLERPQAPVAAWAHPCPGKWVGFQLRPLPVPSSKGPRERAVNASFSASLSCPLPALEASVSSTTLSHSVSSLSSPASHLLPRSPPQFSHKCRSVVGGVRPGLLWFLPGE